MLFESKTLYYIVELDCLIRKDQQQQQCKQQINIFNMERNRILIAES